MTIHIHFWRRTPWSDRHIHDYYECRCGARKVRRAIQGHQPLCLKWLNGGEYGEPELGPAPKPTKPIGAV